MLIVQGIPPLGGIKQGSGGKNKPFAALHINISKTVGDTSKVTIRLIATSNCKSHMRFPLTPRSMTLDDLDLL